MSGTRAAARRSILERVARATGARPGLPHPGGLDTAAATDPAALFVKHFTRQGGEVAVPDPDRAAGRWLTRFLARMGEGVAGVAVGADVPSRMRPELPEVPAPRAGAGISVAWGAAADTGSLILPSTGTRAVQLLPPVHIVWVPAGRILARLEDALRELEPGLPAAVGLHSGPSRSADIGRTVVTGVHGPGRCIAVLEGAGPGNEGRFGTR